MSEAAALLIGYARVSTDDQDLSRQLAFLKEAGCKRVYEEKVSGARRDRPELARMLDNLRDSDVVVITRLDRLARSTRHLRPAVQADGGADHPRPQAGGRRWLGAAGRKDHPEMPSRDALS